MEGRCKNQAKSPVAWESSTDPELFDQVLSNFWCSRVSRGLFVTIQGLVHEQIPLVWPSSRCRVVPYQVVNSEFVPRFSH
jgi:hypothetical protein